MKATGLRAWTSPVFGQLRAARQWSLENPRQVGAVSAAVPQDPTKTSKTILGSLKPFLRFGCDLVYTLVQRSLLGGAPILNGLGRLRESRKVALHFIGGLFLTIKPTFDHLKADGV